MNPVFMISEIRPSMITLVSNILGVASIFCLLFLPPTEEILREVSQSALISELFFVAIVIPRYPSRMYVIILRITLRYGILIPA